MIPGWIWSRCGCFPEPPHPDPGRGKILALRLQMQGCRRRQVPGRVNPYTEDSLPPDSGLYGRETQYEQGRRFPIESAGTGKKIFYYFPGIDNFVSFFGCLFTTACHKLSEFVNRWNKGILNFFGVNKQWMKGLLLNLLERAVSLYPGPPASDADSVTAY